LAGEITVHLQSVKHNN